MMSSVLLHLSEPQSAHLLSGNNRPHPALLSCIYCQVCPSGLRFITFESLRPRPSWAPWDFKMEGGTESGGCSRAGLVPD